MLPELLKKYKSKKLLQLNSFVFRKNITLADVQQYSTELKKEPQRTDFIPYDSEGKFIKNHKPLFVGWDLCNDSSSNTKKVAKLQTHGNSYRIYFDTSNGVTIVSLEHMIDQATYNDLANFFEGNLELS
jgi:hypothetical protein